MRKTGLHNYLIKYGYVSILEIDTKNEDQHYKSEEFKKQFNVSIMCARVCIKDL